MSPVPCGPLPGPGYLPLGRGPVPCKMAGCFHSEILQRLKISESSGEG